MGGYVGPLLYLQRWRGVESLSEGLRFALGPSPPPAPGQATLSAVNTTPHLYNWDSKTMASALQSIMLSYIGLSLTFIWGTDSPVSMASSTIQRPLSSSTSHGTKLSWGERPLKHRIHFNTHWHTWSNVCGKNIIITLTEHLPIETMSPGTSSSLEIGLHFRLRYTCHKICQIICDALKRWGIYSR